MFNKIMTPVDLAHEDRLKKALQVTADLAKHYDAKVIYVSVVTSTPGPLGHTPEEKAERLARFAAAQGELHGIEAGAQALTSHDPSIDLDHTLLKAVGDTGADLVIMASHLPNITDYVWPSNGGTIAGHAKASVLVVRDS